MVNSGHLNSDGVCYKSSKDKPFYAGPTRVLWRSICWFHIGQYMPLTFCMSNSVKASKSWLFVIKLDLFYGKSQERTKNWVTLLVPLRLRKERPHIKNVMKPIISPPRCTAIFSISSFDRVFRCSRFMTWVDKTQIVGWLIEYY